jgi:hypothetical protein
VFIHPRGHDNPSLQESVKGDFFIDSFPPYMLKITNISDIGEYN